MLDGLLAAIAVSLVMLLRNLAEPRVAILGRLDEGHNYVDTERHPEAQMIPGVLIFRPESPLFFANAERIFALIRLRIAAAGALRAVILSLEESPDLDSSSIDALADFAELYRQSGVRLHLTRVKDPARDVLRRADLPQLPASSYSAWSVDDAVSEALASR